MIPALLIWLYNKYIPDGFKNRARDFYTTRLQLTFRKTTILLLILGYSSPSYSQDVNLVYNVMRSGNVIGQMQFNRKVDGQDLYLQMNSQVKTRFLFSINVQTNDKAHFTNGKLVDSYVYRAVNGKEKENKKTTLLNNNYQVQGGSKIGHINKTIDYNMMLLYCHEPVNIPQVYSDSFQQFVAIKKLDIHSYRIDLPNGSYNDYHFQNGTCRKVVLHHDLYTVTMELI